jgi:PAS domain S-box-containing protein
MDAHGPAPDLARLIVTAASDGIFAADRSSGRVLAANPALEAITGYAVESLVVATLEVFVPADGEGDDRDFAPAMLNRPGLHDGVRLRRADGYAFHATLTVGHPDEISHVAVCVVRDATELRLLERELITKHMALRQAFADLEARNAELMDLSTRLSLVSKRAALAEVFAGVAHGFNNPLAAAVSSARLLRTVIEELSEDDPRRARGLRLCDRLDGQGRRMEAIVADLRRACRVGERRDAPVEVAIGAELETVLALFTQRFEGRVELDVSVEELPAALAVPDDLHHVFSNLIDNALRAIGGAGRLWIEARRVGDRIEVAIEDSGPGLPAELATRIFEPFVSRREGGTGIGLSVSSRLVSGWGGDLRTETGRSGGARIVVSLPIKEDSCLRAAS